MNIFEEKRNNSRAKISELSLRLSKLDELKAFPDLTIFTTGSYARDEASTHSDIDLFFFNRTHISKVADRNINTMLLFGRIIDIAKDMGFPKFSNDGAYLKIIESPQILEHLGNSNDDYMNHFTARLLMILESKPLAGHGSYDVILRELLDRYFEDYPDHPENFHPTFLINDIIRFWKTLCLNYENKRNQPTGDEEKKIAQKIKNLKLKFSRMLTCFGSICYISAQNGTIGPEQLIKMTALTPLERMETAAASFSLSGPMANVRNEYEWFLQLTVPSRMIT